MNLLNNDRQAQQIGEYKHYDRCRFCYSNKMAPFIDFGNVPLAGGFIAKGATQKNFKAERLFPLQICFCPNCNLVQINNVIGSDILFKNYFYFSSAIKTLSDHFVEYAKELKQMFKHPKKTLIVEIGSNDGVFMKPLIKQGFNVVGIDPATNVVQPLLKAGYQVLDAFFNEKVAKKVKIKFGQADAIVTSNSFAHIDDMHEVMHGVKTLLKNDGFLAIEVHYLGTLLNEVQYDMMYHEHQSYYSLLALSNFFDMYDMEVYDIKQIPMHAGSMRYYVQNKNFGQRKVTTRAKKLLAVEQKMKLGNVTTYKKFSSYVNKTKKDLLKLLTKLKKEGKTIAGYGASGRATALTSFCGLDEELLDYVVDDAPAKQGAFMPGSHLPIVASDILDDPKLRPDYCVVFAWSFINEIMKKKTLYIKNGGRFIIPLPEVKIVKK